MTRINIEIDDDACQKVIDRFGLKTKSDAANLALRRLAAEELSDADARNFRGIGWEGDSLDLYDT